MKNRIILLFVLFFFFGFAAKAQEISFPPYVHPDRSNVVTLGCKGGVVMPHFFYSDPALRGLGHNMMFRPAGGLFVEFPFEHCSFTPQVMYYGMGMSSTYTYKTNYEVNYLVHSNYLDIRTLVSFRKKLFQALFAYVFVAPGVGVLLDGDLSLTQPGLDISEASLEMTNANMRETNAFLVGGIGTQYYFNMPRFSLTVKVEIGYNYGLTNTFSKKEVEETALPANVHVYNNTGFRFARGVEAFVGFGLPLKFDKMSCGNFGKGKKSGKVNTLNNSFK